MEKDQVMKQLQQVFFNVFDDDSLSIQRETTAENIESWDSLNHVNLMAAIEQEFDVEFTLSEMGELKNVGDMVDLIHELVNE